MAHPLRIKVPVKVDALVKSPFSPPLAGGDLTFYEPIIYNRSKITLGRGKMPKQYEAIYKNGQLQWICPPPVSIENRRVMVLLADEGDEPKSINITMLLSQTRGSLGRRMTMEEIDTDISTMRDEWTRKWDRS